MGTNYYLHRVKKCPTCGHVEDVGEALHIGKSSAGWVFSLRIYPERDIRDLPDWMKLFDEPGAWIEDEYHETVAVDQMLRTIALRYGYWKSVAPERGTQWYWANEAEEGPWGLARPKIGKHCVGHGLGTYSLHERDFS